MTFKWKAMLVMLLFYGGVGVSGVEPPKSHSSKQSARQTEIADEKAQGETAVEVDSTPIATLIEKVQLFNRSGGELNSETVGQVGEQPSSTKQ